MSRYDSKKPKNRMDVWDMLSLFTLMITFCVGLYFVAIYMSPNATYNPFSPARAAANMLPTPTITQIQLLPTWTATQSAISETPTLTLVPTFTLEPSPTVVSLVTPSRTPSPTATPKAPFNATVTYIDSTIIHPEAGCNWQSVAGTIVDSNNADMIGITVRLAGFYNGKTQNQLTVSGISPAFGKSGFEFFLSAVPISSDGLLTIQILDQAGLPLSSIIEIDTFSDCSKNLVLVKFKKNP